jgi:hypothetical protein
VTVVPLKDAVATVESLLLLILNVPLLVFVLIVNVLLAVGYVTVPLASLNVNVFAFLAVVNACVALDDL